MCYSTDHHVGSSIDRMKTMRLNPFPKIVFHTLPFLFPSLLILSCAEQTIDVRVGLDRISTIESFLRDKRIGIVTNHTAIDAEGRHIIDLFVRTHGFNVRALFGPEHGIRGMETGGRAIEDGSDRISDIPVYSLYGQHTKPTAEMLADVDVLVFDIQDIGARFYTYISTMARAMESAAEHRKTFIVLDRPNPIGGHILEGPILQEGFASFVGLFPIPIRHGLTVGELAGMINGEGWLAGRAKADLRVVTIEGWSRPFWLDDTDVPWIKTSPNMPSLETATVYPGICLLEGTNLSEGRGTPEPFEKIGAPWLDPHVILQDLSETDLEGVTFRPITFTPRSIPGAAPHPKFEGRGCRGLELVVTDRDRFRPFRTALALLRAISKTHGDSLHWRSGHFDRLCGTDQVRKMIIDGKSLDEMETVWTGELARFRELSMQYLLYRE